MGSMALWRLAKAGVAVIGLERYAPGHDRGAAGGDTRIFRTAYHEGADYVPLLRRAYDLWRALEAEAGREILTITGGLMIAPPDHPSTLTVLECVRRFGLAHEILSTAELAERYPQHAGLTNETVVLDRYAGVLRSNVATLTAAERAVAAGATLRTYTRVTEVVPDAHGVTVRTSDGDLRVAKAIVAGGPWSGQLDPWLDKRIYPRRLVSAWFLPREPAEFGPDRFPIALRRGAVDTSVLPAVDGGFVKVNGYTPQGEDLHRQDADSIDYTVEASDYQPHRLVTRFLPGLFPEPVRVGVYRDGYTADGQSLVGWLPTSDRVLSLSGFSGHGFKLAPVFGEIAAALVTEGRTDLPIGHLDPGRVQ